MRKFMLVLFNLKPGKADSDFREWMRLNDFPVVSELDSIDEYNLCKTVKLLGPGVAPYSHMEIIRIADFDHLERDAQSPAVQAVGGQFVAEWADNPVFMLVEQVL
jgi:hypothetical protein